jgi:preprotein translocase subunit SecE
VNKHLLPIIIWVVVIGVAFGFAWWKGYVQRLRDYWNATMEELRKCAWPTWEELKGSTVVVSITILLLGAFCFVVDTIFRELARFLSNSVS